MLHCCRTKKVKCLLPYMQAYKLYSQKGSSSSFDYERIVDEKSLNYPKMGQFYWYGILSKHCTKSYIPVTTTHLFETILLNQFRNSDITRFKDKVKLLERRLQMQSRSKLRMIKSLYNPISFDRDTVQLKEFSSEELHVRTGEFIKEVSELLSQAGFYELPDEILRIALHEKRSNDRLNYVIPSEQFEILKVWVIGIDLAPYDHRSMYNKAKNAYQRNKDSGFEPLDHHYHDSYFVTSKVKRKIVNDASVHRIERYKRVLIMFRRKDDYKLHLKAFKDIPCENLKFLIPDGKLRIKSLNKYQVSLLASLLVLCYGAGTFVNVSALTIMLISIRGWNMSRNLKRTHLLNLSKLLFFKSVASNHALLPLLIDRSEDEVFKTCLLVLDVLSGIEQKEDVISKEQLNSMIQTWLKTHLNLSLEIDTSESISVLQQIGILKRYKDGFIIDEDMKSWTPNTHAFK